MALASLAARNIKRSFSKYVMYFFALSFSVFTVNSFLALVFNEQVMKKLTYSRNYQSMLTGFGIVIFVFVAFFLISSNASFIRARKKEIATYSLFGMTNSKIGRLLFMETLIIGTAALAVGVGFGIFCSKLTAMILLNISLTHFVGDIPFTVAPLSVWLTIIPFALVFILMGISGRIVIAKFELVELFKAGKLPETRVRGSVVQLTASIVLIGIGYYWATIDVPATLVLLAVPILIAVIAGTFLFFLGGLPPALCWLGKSGHRHLRGENLIALSTFGHRIRSIASVMAVIAVMSAVATTAIATGYTLYASAEKSAYDQLSFDLFFYGGQEQVLDEIHAAFAAHNAEILEEYTVDRYQARAVYDDGSGQAAEQYFRVLSETDYNRLVQVARKRYQPIEVKPGWAFQSVRLSLTGSNQDEMQEGKHWPTLLFSDYELKVVPRVDLANVHFGAYRVFIISDEDFARLMRDGDITAADPDGGQYAQATVFKYENPLRAHELNRELNRILRSRVGGYRLAYNHYVESIEVFGLVCFIGSFMSVVFILMTASLLYFKQITAADEERHLYQMLRKIGVDAKTEARVITKRLLPVFFMPLLMGIAHSVFAMKSANTMVFQHVLDVENSFLVVMQFSAIMYGVYALVYSLFYLVTKRQYSNAVS